VTNRLVMVLVFGTACDEWIRHGACFWNSLWRMDSSWYLVFGTARDEQTRHGPCSKQVRKLRSLARCKTACRCLIPAAPLWTFFTFSLRKTFALLHGSVIAAVVTESWALTWVRDSNSLKGLAKPCW